MLRLVVCLVGLWALSVHAQPSCQPWDGGPRFCKEIIDYSIWSPVPGYQDQVYNSLKQLGAGIAYFPSECAVAYADLLCQTHLPACLDDTGAAIPVPRPPCQSECQTVQGICEPHVQRAMQRSKPGETLYTVAMAIRSLNCSAMSTIFAGAPVYPESWVEYDLTPLGSAETVNVTCSSRFVTEVETLCSSPLEFDITKNTCGYPCPNPMYNWERYHAMYIILCVYGYVGFFGSGFVVVSYAMMPEKRQNVAIFYAISTMLFCMCFVVQSWFPPKEVWCSSNTTESKEGAKCLVSGSFFYWGLLALHCWWLIIAFNMFYTLVLKRKRGKILTVVYHVFSWGLPTVYLIVALATKQIGYTRTTANCQLGNVNPGDAKDVWMSIVPILGLMVLGTPFLGITMYQVYKRYQGEKRSVLFANIRVLAFLVLFLYYSSVLTAVRFEGINYQTVGGREIRNNVLCRLIARAGEEDDCPYNRNNTFPYKYPLWWTINIGILALSPLVFFGCKGEIYRFWRNRFQKSLTSTSSSRHASGHSSKAFSRRSAEMNTMSQN